jgi:hypothetical protein
MRILRATPEITLWLLIVGVALLNVALYTGVVEGEDAINIREDDFVALDEGESPRERAIAAENDDSGNLPGTFVASQGRQHTGSWAEEHTVEFCPGGIAADGCYASNPPTSGLHLPVERNVTLPSGDVINIPPDPGIYDFKIPRESIPHLQEHAGVYAGYNCSSESCFAAVDNLENLVNQLLALEHRVVLAPSSDLPADTIGLASWTRFDTFPAADYTEQRASLFIEAHSCRFDPEGFCE